MPPDPQLSPEPETAKAATGQTLELIATPDMVGARLDRAVAGAHSTLSRSRVKALIESGHVRLLDTTGNHAETIDNPSYKVKPGQRFRIHLPPAEPATPEGQAIPLAIVYEDDDVIVIDKPAGMVVHPAPGNPDRTLVNALIAHCGTSLSGIGGVRRPGIVHRIDKDTSGLMIAAKNDAAHQALSAAFARHDIERAYCCLVAGLPTPRQGEIKGNIGRHPVHRQKMAVVSRGGKTALTHYRVIENFGLAASLVECRLETGRTHQIRVHMSSIGHPLLGDPVYGRSSRERRADLGAEAMAAVKALGRQALHASLLGIRHPRTGALMRWQSPLPADMTALIAVLRGISQA